MQEALLSVTNPNEGVDFVNQGVSTTAAEYSLNVFPGLSAAQARIIGALYASQGSDLSQVNLVQGECESIYKFRNTVAPIHLSAIFICPTYYLLNAFKGRAFKVDSFTRWLRNAPH
jgi:hypothetical protein